MQRIYASLLVIAYLFVPTCGQSPTIGPYVGNQCPAVYEGFNITYPQVASPEIDQNVAKVMNMVQNEIPWMQVSCASRIRQQYCMLALTPPSNPPLTADGLAYCQKKCFAAGSEGCQELIAITAGTESGAQVEQLLFGYCSHLPITENCHNGTLSTYVEPNPICPEPLVLPDSESAESPAKIEMIPGSACAVPCPGLLFGRKDWNIFSLIAISAYTISTVLVSISLWHHAKKLSNNFNIVMVCIGCFNASFWMSMYHIVNYSTENSFICKGNAGYIEYDNFCVFCGFMLLASGNWYSCWSFFISMQLWLGVRFNYPHTKLAKMRSYMVAFSFILFILILIPLGVGNIGYEWEGGTLNMCVNKNVYTGDQEGVPWHFVFSFTPIFLFGFFLPLILMVDSLRIVTSVRRQTFGLKNRKSVLMIEDGATLEVERADSTRSTSTVTIFEGLKSFVTANSRPVKFIFIFVSLTGLFVWTDIYGLLNAQNQQSKLTESVKCLLKYATIDPSYAYTQCPHMTVASFQAYTMLLFASLFASFPFFVFGTGGKLWKYATTYAGYFISSHTNTPSVDIKPASSSINTAVDNRGKKEEFYASSHSTSNPISVVISSEASNSSELATDSYMEQSDNIT